MEKRKQQKHIDISREKNKQLNHQSVIQLIFHFRPIEKRILFFNVRSILWHYLE